MKVVHTGPLIRTAPFSLLMAFLILAQACLAAEEEQITLEELKRRFQENWVTLSDQIPVFGMGEFALAYSELALANSDFTREVMRLVADRDAEEKRAAELTRQVEVQSVQNELLQKEMQWFLSNAQENMQSFEMFREKFRHPALDKAEVLYVGSPLCQRSGRLSLPAGTMLANFSYSVPRLVTADGRNREAVFKRARLLAAPLAKPEAVQFGVLRRFPPDAVDKGVYRVVAVGRPGKATRLETVAGGKLILYQWELPVVMPAGTGDCLAIVFEGPAEIACDYTGHTRFGTVPIPGGGKISEGQEFDYSDFTIPAPGEDRGLQEAATCSMGFLGWPALE